MCRYESSFIYPIPPSFRGWNSRCLKKAKLSRQSYALCMQVGTNLFCSVLLFLIFTRKHPLNARMIKYNFMTFPFQIFVGKTSRQQLARQLLKYVMGIIFLHGPGNICIVLFLLSVGVLLKEISCMCQHLNSPETHILHSVFSTPIQIVLKCNTRTEN